MSFKSKSQSKSLTIIYLSHTMSSGSVIMLRLLESCWIGKRPPSFMSPDKLNRSVGIFCNQSGELALQLCSNTQDRTNRNKCDAMMHISWNLQLELYEQFTYVLGRHKMWLYANFEASWPSPSWLVEDSLLRFENTTWNAAHDKTLNQKKGWTMWKIQIKKSKSYIYFGFYIFALNVL